MARPKPVPPLYTITNAAGTTQTLTNSYNYDDENDQMSEFTDANGNVNTMEYKDNEIVILTPQASGSESVLTTYIFDYKNNLYKVSDTEGKTISYKRDTTNDTFAVTDIIYADGTTDKVSYDVNYNVLETTDPSGDVEKNEYDGQGNGIEKYE